MNEHHGGNQLWDIKSRTRPSVAPVFTQIVVVLLCEKQFNGLIVGQSSSLQIHVENFTD